MNFTRTFSFFVKGMVLKLISQDTEQSYIAYLSFLFLNFGTIYLGMENIFLLKQRLNRHRLVVFVVPIIDLNGLKCNTFSLLRI